MSTVYKDVRYTTRERERSPSSDDEKYKSTTVRRYKVTPAGSSSSRIERYEEDDDVRSRYSHSHVGGHPSGDFLEVDRRTTYTTDRPRPTYESPTSPRDREFSYYRDDGDKYRSVKYESRSRERRYPWEDAPETEMRIEKRVERSPDGDVRIKEKIEERREEPRDVKEKELRIERRVVEKDPYDDHHRHHHHHEYDHDEVERYRKEVEYYNAPNPPASPIVIRNKAPEQKVVVHEAPHPAPIIYSPPRNEPNIIVFRDGHHHEVSRRDDRRAEEEYWRRRAEMDAMERYERRRREERDHESDGVDEDYYVKRTVIRRDRSDSSDHHKKRHLAEGALAGAGISALVAGGGRKGSDSHGHRGRKVLAGAALGALGTEVVRRAKSAYEDRYDEYDYDDDDRHRHRSKSRSRVKTGLAIVSFFSLGIVAFSCYSFNPIIPKTLLANMT